MKMDEFIDNLCIGFESMENSEMVIHHKTRLHSFGEYILLSLANTECNGSDGAISAIILKRESKKAEEPMSIFEKIDLINFYSER